VFGDSFTEDKPGYKEACELLSGPSSPDAFFCFNDQIAASVYEAIVHKGLIVGRDVGLIGYGNDHVCEKLPVKLTAVSFDSFQIGSKAVELLLKMIKGETVSRNKLVILHPELIVRESSNAALPVSRSGGDV